jgi:hypothetical protein
MVGYVWRKHETFELDEPSVDSALNDFEAFVDNPSCRFVYFTPLINFKGPTSVIELPKGLRIRQMTEKEVSAMHGGPMEQVGMLRSRAFNFHEYCIEGELFLEKTFGDQEAERPTQHVKELLDKAVLSLRTFKAGPVGYDFVEFRTLSYCPLPVPSLGLGDLFVPFGEYSLGENEIVPFKQHAEMLFRGLEPAMEMACSRLADAETRSEPQDRLVDAVIGMEALLLAGLESTDRRSELKYRFSLHYSTLFNTPEERLEAFRVAKHLYDLRSTVAHGSAISDRRMKIGSEELELRDAANRASETLRRVVQHFLPLAKLAPYKNHRFWESAYFGLKD